MDIPQHEVPVDPATAARRDGRRFRAALLATLVFVALLWGLEVFKPMLGGWSGLGVAPREPAGLIGVLVAPLLHGSVPHLVANTLPMLVLGMLSLVLYPHATRRALPLIWLGAGLFVWLVGRPPQHIGASGLSHGLMFFVFVSGLLRRDRPGIAGALIAFFLYGGMLLTVLPREPNVSWEYHLGGALFGVLGAILWRRLDPAPPRRRYSWEIEEEQAARSLAAEERGMYERRAPDDVPVLWHRPEPDAREENGVVIAFPQQRDAHRVDGNDTRH